MKLNLYQIDAFATRLFEGNPAAVVPLDEWLPDETMQAIAKENNLSETVFFTQKQEGFHIRWFTPVAEVKLCGHATLASAYVIFNKLGYQGDTIIFDSLSGELKVNRTDDKITLNFPSQPAQACVAPPALIDGLNGVEIKECLVSEDYIAVLENEEALRALKPNQRLLTTLDKRGVIVTASSTQYDFVARFFSPKHGIPEDPVTGSAYTQLTPYWADKLGRSKLKAKQLSDRGGELLCSIEGDRVFISGQAISYLEGQIEI